MYNVKIKQFYDGRKVYQFSTYPITGVSKEPNSIGANEEPITDKVELLARSHRRTKNEIYDIAFNNPWEYFLTVTFDGKKVDRYNYEEVSKKFSKMLNNLKQRKAPNLQYIAVPELHKDGAIHFHGLLLGTQGLTFKDSGKRDRMKRPILNCDEFNLGFNTVTRIGDPSKAATYITKYISKELSEQIPGKHYWHSRGLTEVKVEKMLMHEGKKRALMEEILSSEILAGSHYTRVSNGAYENNFTYIVTHPGANREDAIKRLLVQEMRKDK